MHVAGLMLDHPIIQQPSSGIPYECLSYKQSLSRLDSTSGLYNDCSTHMIWVVKERGSPTTRQVEEARTEIENLWRMVGEEKNQKKRHYQHSQ
ncbi:unnamed protein product [Arabidopsis halleri]